MAKSIAETVDFANAVEKKAYEKKAAQVDTFVQSESAEQKLARSGKMQTAKAIEGLAGLGQTALDLKASANKAKVEELREQIVEVTTNAITEGENAGVHWSKTQSYADMPELIKMDIAQRAGDRNNLNKVNEFKQKLAADSTIIDDEVRYSDLVNEVFSPFETRDISDPYTAMSVSRENEKDRVFLEEHKVEHNKAMDAKLVKERISDFTMVVNDHIGSYDANLYATDPAKFVKTLTTDMVLNEKGWMKTSGLLAPQTNAVIQDALVKYAQDHDMPELLNNDYIPKQYRSGEFDSFAEQERQSILGKQRTAAVQQANIDKLAREEHAREMDDEAYVQHLNGYIDLESPENIAKGKVFLRKAKEFNDLFTSQSYSYAKIGNSAIFRQNLSKALLNDAIPFTDVKGNVVDIKMNLRSLTEYVRHSRDFSPEMKKKLIPQLRDTLTFNALKTSDAYIEGMEYVKPYIDDNYVDDTAQRATNLYLQILQEEWRVEQSELSKTDPDADISLNDSALLNIKQKALSRWESHPIVTGAQKADDNGLGTSNALGKITAERNAAKERVKSKTQPKKPEPLPEKWLKAYWKKYEQDPEAANQMVIDQGYAIPTKK